MNLRFEVIQAFSHPHPGSSQRSAMVGPLHPHPISMIKGLGHSYKFSSLLSHFRRCL